MRRRWHLPGLVYRTLRNMWRCHGLLGCHGMMRCHARLTVLGLPIRLRPRNDRLFTRVRVEIGRRSRVRRRRFIGDRRKRRPVWLGVFLAFGPVVTGGLGLCLRVT